MCHSGCSGVMTLQAAAGREVGGRVTKKGMHGAETPTATMTAMQASRAEATAGAPQSVRGAGTGPMTMERIGSAIAIAEPGGRMVRAAMSGAV